MITKNFKVLKEQSDTSTPASATSKNIFENHFNEQAENFYKLIKIFP